MGFISYLAEQLSFNKNLGPALGSFYDFTVTTTKGDKVSLSEFRGHAFLLVNTASNCGFTKQYAALQQLHEQHHDKIKVIGFPANDFLWQEPGTNEDIASFCSVNYGVTFLMSEKISVRGKSRHPLFTWLSAKAGRVPTWNFCKYVVTTDGSTVHFFPSRIDPLDRKITDLFL